MAKICISTLLVISGAILALSALSSDNISSREVPGEPLKGVNMDRNMGLSVPENHERATFGHG